MESDSSDVSDEDVTSDSEKKVENSPVLSVEPFRVILKGGSPWGFTLKGGAEVRAPIQISEVRHQIYLTDILLSGNIILYPYTTAIRQLFPVGFNSSCRQRRAPYS